MAAEPLGCALASDLPACGTSSSGVQPLRHLASLLSLTAQRQVPPAAQWQQAAGYAAARRRDDDDEDDEPAVERPGQHSKLSHSERRLLIERKLQRRAQEEEEEEDEEEVAAARERHRIIKGLLTSMGEQDAASSFVNRCVCVWWGGEEPG